MTWNLQENAPEGATGGGRFGPRGPEVLPGTFTVRVRAGEASSERLLTVLPDPRVEVPMPQRLAKREAILKSLELNERGRVLREKVEEVANAVQRLNTLLEDQPEVRESLQEPLRAVRTEQGQLNEQFREMNRNARAAFSLGSSRDAPTEAQRVALERLERDINQMQVRVNDFLQGPVAELRSAVETSGIEVFPRMEVVR